MNTETISRALALFFKYPCLILHQIKMLGAKGFNLNIQS